MNYIIFDLEFNQAFNDRINKKTIVNTKCPFEIIQIGALKLNNNLQVISTFNALVKPKIYKEMHPFVEKITNITIDELMLAKPFNEVYEDFCTFVEDIDNVFCIWGMSDIKELFRNIAFHQLNSNVITKKYINVQYYASKNFKMPNKNNIGLKNAIELLGIPINKQFHDAFNDAYYTAEIFKKLHIHMVKSKTYDLSQIRRSNRYRLKEPKKKIDKHGLIKQFEKMYERKLTEEEKSMIILSYKMGLTNQFQRDISRKD